jgi:hypothetical protein
VKFGFALFDDEKGMPARWVRVAFVIGSKRNITSLFSTNFSERALGKAVRAHCANVFVGPPPSSSLEPLTLDDQCAALFLRASDEVRPSHHSILRFHALDKMSMFHRCHGTATRGTGNGNPATIASSGRNMKTPTSDPNSLPRFPPLGVSPCSRPKIAMGSLPSTRSS